MTKQENYEEVMRRLALLGEPEHTYGHENSPTKYYGDPVQAHNHKAQEWQPRPDDDITDRHPETGATFNRRYRR